MRISVIIPTLNEEETLEEVIEGCEPFCDEILVVDGHSTDGTERIARNRNVRFLLDEKKGKGAAMRRSVEFASGDVIVFIDADGSHNPDDIPELIEPILKNEADHVTASRLLGGSSELHGGFDEFLRLSGSAFITFCINKRYGVCISDSQNGFRAIRKDVFTKLNLKSSATTMEQEMTMRTLARGFRLVEIPSHEYRRKGGESKVNVFRVWHKHLLNLVVGIFFLRKTSHGN